MPVKSIINVDVQDESFSKFHEKFSAYLGELDKQQEKWEAAGKAMGLSGEALAGGAFNAKESLAVAAAQAGIISEALTEAVKAQNDLGNATKRSGEHMNKLQKGAAGVGNAIKSIGGWIIKLGALGGIGSLLSGLGIADLAGAAFNRSKSAGGLGISTGQLTSFQVNAQQFLGESALRGAITAQSDVSKWGAFGALGLDVDKARSEDPRLLAIDALQKATERYNQDKKTGLPYGSDPILALYQSALGGNLDDIRNAALHPGQLGRARSAMLRDDRELNISYADQQAMIEFKKALDRAGMSIETTFIHGLAPLAPELDNLSGQFKGFVKDVLGSQNAKDAINFLAGGLHSLGATLASPAFGKDLKDVGYGISWIAHELNKWLPKGWNVLADPKSPLNKVLNASEDAKYSPLNDKFFGNVGDAVSQFRANAGNFFGGIGKKFGPEIDVAKKVATIAMAMGVDPYLALATAMRESGMNPRAQGDKNKKGGYDSSGLFQLNRYGEGAGLSLAQMFDPQMNTKIALSRFAYLQKLGEKATENLFSKAVRSAAAHHVGPSASHEQIAALFGTPGMLAAAAQRPSDPYDYAIHINEKYKALALQKHETEKKTSRPIKGRATKTPIHVSIYNATSSRVVVGVNAVATA